MEEAGEVFEAHILASLAPTTEHLILIGDHEQLRPKPQLYALQVMHPASCLLTCFVFSGTGITFLRRKVVLAEPAAKPIDFAHGFAWLGLLHT